MDFLGGLIGAGTKLLGGIFSNNNQEKINQQNIQAQAALNATNIAEQEKFAQTSAQWRAADATAGEAQTGINRLTLLGAPSSSFSNLVGATSQASTALGDAMGGAGHDLGRAIAAASPLAQRNAELENKLLEAKIANMNADTIRTASLGSTVATKLGQPGTGPSVPFPREDPRGPVIPLVQRAFDWRTGEYVNIPSKEAASPLQTLAATPTNAAMAGRSLSEGLRGLDGNRDNWSLFNSSGARGDSWRAADPQQYTPF